MAVSMSERHVVTVSTPSGRFKIFAVAYGRDGTLYVYLPYFSDTHGILGAAVGTAGDNGRLTYDAFVPVSKTSHTVKFSYHADGTSHFSQDGKISTSLRRDSAPIAEARGPVFYVYAHGLEQFARVANRDVRADETRKAVYAAAFDTDLDGVSFTGFLKPSSELASDSYVGHLVPADGIALPAIGVGPLPGTEQHERVLAITVEPAPFKTEKPTPSCLIFSGPFQNDPTIGDPSKRSSQMVVYPASLAEGVLDTLPSVDYSTIQSSAD